MENRPKIRVTQDAYKIIKLLAKKGNRSMTRQITEILATVSHPENGREVLDGMAIIIREGDNTKITEKTVIATGRSINHEVGDV